VEYPTADHEVVFFVQYVEGVYLANWSELLRLLIGWVPTGLAEKATPPPRTVSRSTGQFFEVSMKTSLSTSLA
jgi:hypothetical protein